MPFGFGEQYGQGFSRQPRQGTAPSIWQALMGGQPQQDYWVQDPMLFNALQRAAQFSSASPAAGLGVHAPYNEQWPQEPMSPWHRMMMALAPYIALLPALGASRQPLMRPGALPFASKQLPLAPVTYRGFQEGGAGYPGFHLWNLTKAVGKHPINDTLSTETLARLGYRVPPVPK